MKHLILTFLCLSCSFSYAQLTVRNATYVYSENVVLYVEDDVSLKDDASTIYLRDESQLIQGAGTTGNSGIGRLSVFQTGTSNTYMYNYWCSPVGINSGGAGNSVFTPSVNFYDHIGHVIPALDPITSSLATYTNGYNGTATSGTTPQIISNYWLYTFIGTTAAPNEYQDWVGLGGGSLPVGGVQNGTLASGYGFTMKGNPSTHQKYDFRGRPNNGTITTTLNSGRETLVGNPYPSAIDAVAFIHDVTNKTLLNGTLSFWEQDPLRSTSHVLVNYLGGYATYTIDASGGVETFTPATFNSYNADGTLNTMGGETFSMKRVRRYIPIGQGFMIRGKATGNVRMTNDMRVFEKESGGSSEFFRTTETSQNEESNYNEDGLFILPEAYKRFRLNIDFNETYTRQLLQNFHETATPGDDYGLETTSPEALNSDAYWPQEDKALNAQAFAFNQDLHIPMVINVAQNQPIRFRILDIQNFEESQPIYIHDIENDIYVDLRTTNYEINLPQGTYTNRFEITFTSEALNIEQIITAEDLNIFQNNQLSQLSISNPKFLEIKQVSLFDVSGKQIIDARNLKTEANYSFSTKNLSQGVYVANVTFADNQTVSKKIVVSNK